VFQSLAVSLVLSRLDHGNATLSGIPQYLLRRLQSVMNSAVRLVFSSSRYNHITPLLRQLHWLKAAERIDFKFAYMEQHRRTLLMNSACRRISAHNVAFVQRHLHHWSSVVRVCQPSATKLFLSPPHMCGTVCRST